MTEPSFVLKVESLKTANINEMEGVVVNLNWVAFYGNNIFFVTRRGECYLPLPENKNKFKPLTDLNQETALEWLQSEMWVETVETMLKKEYEVKLPLLEQSALINTIDSMKIDSLIRG